MAEALPVSPRAVPLPPQAAPLPPLARIAAVAGLGMVQVRADLDRAGDAIAEAAGLAIPARTRIVSDGERGLGWMSPDELLLVLPAAGAAEAVAALGDALAGEHHLVLDVSAMRCVLDVTDPGGRGAGAAEVLAKLCPVDLAAFPADGLRRTRMAQVAAAFWRIEDGFRVVAFRSVAGYAEALLHNAATPGTSLAPR